MTNAGHYDKAICLTASLTNPGIVWDREDFALTKLEALCHFAAAYNQFCNFEIDLSTANDWPRIPGAK